MTIGMARPSHGMVHHRDDVSSSRCDERGATLLLALMFLVVVSLIMLAMAALATTALANTAKFSLAQSTVTAANGAAQIALDNARSTFYEDSLNAKIPVPCWGSSSSPSQVSSDNVTMDTWCTTRWSPFSQATRTVTISTCGTAVSAQRCATAPLLQVIVVFDDYPTQSNSLVTSNATCLPQTTVVPSQESTCGVGVSIASWSFGSQPPTIVSAVMDTQTGCVVVTGTGFETLPSNETVSFVVGPASDNQVYSFTPSATSATSATVCGVATSLPSGVSLSGATVVLTTPYGPSAQLATVA